MPDWRASALVLVGHGSTRNRASRLPTEHLADKLRTRALFAEVRACFLKEKPFLGGALDDLSAATAYVVPNFAGQGYLTREVVPREMGLTGPVTHRTGRNPRLVHYAAPVGTHPRIPQILRTRALTILQDLGVRPREACILLIGHGSGRPGGSAETPEAIAAALRSAGDFGEVRTAYLEQEPRVADWSRTVRSRYVVVAPLLVAEGLHGSEDLPPLFGMEPGRTGAGEAAGRLIWFCGGIGSGEDIVDIVLDLVRACDAAEVP